MQGSTAQSNERGSLTPPLQRSMRDPCLTSRGDPAVARMLSCQLPRSSPSNASHRTARTSKRPSSSSTSVGPPQPPPGADDPKKDATPPSPVASAGTTAHTRRQPSADGSRASGSTVRVHVPSPPWPLPTASESGFMPTPLQSASKRSCTGVGNPASRRSSQRASCVRDREVFEPHCHSPAASREDHSRQS